MKAFMVERGERCCIKALGMCAMTSDEDTK